jgi:peptidoglycan hydrolase-like protein with peptidoglycan-binding domain
MMAGKPRPIALTDATGTVVALPRPRPVGVDTARPAGETAKPAEAAKPVPAPGRPHSIAELVKPPSEASKPEAAAGRPRQQVIADIQRELSRRGFFDGPTDGIHGPKTDAAIRDFEHAAKLKASAQPDEALLRVIQRTSIQAVAATRAEPAPRAETSRADVSRAEPPPRPPAAIRTAATAKSQAAGGRVVAVQRALADYGYGQLTPNGVLGPETRAAIERFERERKLPVTGQISQRLTRELAAVTGRPLE